MSGICNTVVELAARHALDADELLEVWGERAAIREYLAGSSRKGAELSALHDVERMFRIGLHCQESLRLATAAGDRKRPAAARPMVHAVAREIAGRR